MTVFAGLWVVASDASRRARCTTWTNACCRLWPAGIPGPDATAGMLLLQAMAQSMSAPTRWPSFTPWSPSFAALFGWIWLGEVLTERAAAGGAIVVLAVIAIAKFGKNRASPRKTLHSKLSGFVANQYPTPCPSSCDLSPVFRRHCRARHCWRTVTCPSAIPASAAPEGGARLWFRDANQPGSWRAGHTCPNRAGGIAALWASCSSWGVVPTPMYTWRSASVRFTGVDHSQTGPARCADSDTALARGAADPGTCLAQRRRRCAVFPAPCLPQTVVLGTAQQHFSSGARIGATARHRATGAAWTKCCAAYHARARSWMHAMPCGCGAGCFLPVLAFVHDSGWVFPRAAAGNLLGHALATMVCGSLAGPALPVRVPIRLLRGIDLAQIAWTVRPAVRWQRPYREPDLPPTCALAQLLRQCAPTPLVRATKAHAASTRPCASAALKRWPPRFLRFDPPRFDF